MAVDAAMLEEARMAVAALPANTAGPDLSPLQSLPELLGYVATSARAGEGLGEADMVEVLVRLANLPPADVRAAAITLERLGYRDVSDRLRQITGRRTRSLKPLI
jgi:hypothetical protein